MSTTIKAWILGSPHDGRLIDLNPDTIPETLYLPDEDPMRFTLAEGTGMLRYVYRRDGKPWESVLHGRVVDYRYERVEM